jgi:nitrate/nitrite transporter NarK
MQFLVVLCVAALFVRYFWVLVAGIAVAWLVRIIVKEWRAQSAEIRAAREAEAARLDGLRARADQQHNWRMQGDPRGTYGETLAAPM